MDIVNMQVIVLVAILFTVAALFIIVRSLKLPDSHFKNEKARSEIRMKLREKEYEEKLPKNDETPEDK